MRTLSYLHGTAAAFAIDGMSGGIDGFRIIHADERMKEKKGIKAVVFGPAKVGKTSLLWTLDAKTTLFVDLEAGDLAVEGWQGASVRPRTWEECRDLAVWLAGPNPALRAEQPYSLAHYNYVVGKYGNPVDQVGHFDTYFVDSITVAGRLCFQYCKGQPEAFSEKTGKADVRGAYGLHGREMISWISTLQHIRNKNIVFVGLLDERTDEFGRKSFSPQIDGSKTGLELPGILDEILTMTTIKGQDDKPHRVLVCHATNEWGYPAGDRSGRLDLIEQPHLGRLFEKIRQPLKKPAADRLVFADPSAIAAAPVATPAI